MREDPGLMHLECIRSILYVVLVMLLHTAVPAWLSLAWHEVNRSLLHTWTTKKGLNFTYAVIHETRFLYQIWYFHKYNPVLWEHHVSMTDQYIKQLIIYVLLNYLATCRLPSRGVVRKYLQCHLMERGNESPWRMKKRKDRGEKKKKKKSINLS